MPKNTILNIIMDKVKVLLNGRWLGVSLEPIKLYHYVKTLKYKGIVHIYTSVVFDYSNKIIYINNDAGRLMRPVYKVNNNKKFFET